MPVDTLSKVIQMTPRKPALCIEVIVTKSELDPLRPLTMEERESIRVSFHDCHRSVRSIARMLDRPESVVEKALRLIAPQMENRARIVRSILDTRKKAA